MVVHSPATACHRSGWEGRPPHHLIAFVAIAFIPILSRRLKRLVVDEISA
jgi:hypothetical protein